MKGGSVDTVKVRWKYWKLQMLIWVLTFLWTVTGRLIIIINFYIYS